MKVRSKTADDWRDAYLLTQQGRNLLLVIPEGMIYPGGTRRSRLSLIVEQEPEAYHAPSMGRTTKSDHHHESVTMAASVTTPARRCPAWAGRSTFAPAVFFGRLTHTKIGKLVRPSRLRDPFEECFHWNLWSHARMRSKGVLNEDFRYAIPL